MKPEALELLERYCEDRLGKPIQSARPLPLTGSETVCALWPLNAVFRPLMARINSVRYDVSFLEEADAALVRAAFSSIPIAENWAATSPGAWRVLLERHQQAIVLAVANEQARNPVAFIPEGLQPADRLGFVLLYLLWGMALPFSVEDRSTLALPEGDAPESMRLH